MMERSLIALPAGASTVTEPRSELISERLLNVSRLVRVVGVLSLRNTLKLSQSAFAQVLAHYAGGKVYTKAAICNWERAEREPGNLPRGYWRKLAPPKKVIAAMHRLITDLVTWATRGRSVARVTGVRVWRVRLVAAGAHTIRRV